MDKNDLRIVFMGTPEFAVPALRLLHGSGYRITGVVTAPDRPAGRGKKLRASAVKDFALQHGLPVLQPEKLKDETFVERLVAMRPHLQVVVAFRMLPEAVWRIPSMGTFNLHASLLPDYRGAAPINHVIMNGEEQTGVTTFLIDHQIDTGNILLQEAVRIGPEETAGELHDRLMVAGAKLVKRTVEELSSGSIRPAPQETLIRPGTTLRSAPKLQKEDGRIDWHREGRSVVNQIRGLSPYPGAYTHMVKAGSGKTMIKIYAAGYLKESHRHKPGTVLFDAGKELKVAVADGYVSVGSLQQEGKKRMDTLEFLKGFKIPSGRLRFS